MSDDKAETRKRTSKEIEADLKKSREDLTRTVDEISDKVDPRRQVQVAKEKGRSFVEDVKAGKGPAVQIAGGVGAGVAGLIGLILLRKNRKG